MLCALVLTGAALLNGCKEGKKDTLDAILHARIMIREEMADLLEGVTDKESAEETLPKLEALLKRDQDLARQEEKVSAGGITPQTMKRIAKMQKDELMSSLARLEKARSKALEDPEIAEVLENLALPRFPASIAVTDD
jgi:hypothetical protein